MNRRDFLPTYHFEDTESNEIKDLAEEKLRDYIITGNHGKNLIPFPYVSKAGTQNGVDITIDDNGVITLNGTATEAIYFGLLSPVNSSEITKPGKYSISGMTQTVEGVSVQCYADGQWHSKYRDIGNGAVFDITNSITYVTLQINNGAVCDNLIIKPMLINTEESNILTYPYANTTKTIHGITFTDNKDGSIKVNGTATENGIFYITTADKKIKYTGKKLFVGCPTGGNTTTYRLSINLYKISGSTSTYVTGFNDVGSGIYVDFDAYEYDTVEISIRVSKDSVCDNVVFNPNVVDMMFEKYCGVGDKTRNLIPYPYKETTKTINGVTFTDNGDGSITVNGTAVETGKAFFIIHSGKWLSPGKYYLGGCPAQGNSASCYLITNGYGGVTDTGEGVIFDLSGDEPQTNMVIYVKPGKAIENLTFHPMLVDLDAQNLIPYPYARTTQTINGVTFTDNGDGTITINGTATANAWYPLSTRSASTIYATKGKYYLSGCPSGGGALKYYLQCNVYNDTTQVIAFNEFGNGTTRDLNSHTFTSISVNFTVCEGVTVNNLTFRPLLVNMDDVSSYEPYGYKIELLNKPWNNLINVDDFEVPQLNGYYAAKTITLTDSSRSLFLPYAEEMKGKNVTYSCNINNTNFKKELICFYDEKDESGNNKFITIKERGTFPTGNIVRLAIRARSENTEYNNVNVKISNITLKYEDIEEEKQDIYLKNQIMDDKEASYKTYLLNDIILHKDMINDLSINSKVKPKKVSYSYYTYKYPNKNN